MLFHEGIAESFRASLICLFYFSARTVMHHFDSLVEQSLLGGLLEFGGRSYTST